MCLTSLLEAMGVLEPDAKHEPQPKRARKTDDDVARPNICICGAGNAAHVFSSLFPAWGFTTTVWAGFDDEAERFKAATDVNGGVVVKNRSDPNNVVAIQGKPAVVTKNAHDVVPQADVIIAALPSFAMETVFKGIKEHLKEGVIIYIMPGSGGCEFLARDILGDELRAGKCTLAGIMPMPVNARITSWGSEVDLASIKVAYDISALPMESAPRAASIFQTLLKQPARSVGSFIGMALNGGNPNNHPPRLMAAWKDHVEGKTYSENPLFYETWDDEAEMWCDKISKERLSIWNTIVAKFPKVGPANHMMDVRTYMATAYKGQISDDSSIKTVFTTNAGLTGFHFPMIFKEGEGPLYCPKVPDYWEIDFSHRYFTEDIPEGLCVYKGYADLAGVDTPGIDQILEHFQKFMGKEYIKDGKLAGKDVMSTKAPQAFGYTTLESLLSE